MSFDLFGRTTFDDDDDNMSYGPQLDDDYNEYNHGNFGNNDNDDMFESQYNDDYDEDDYDV